MNRRSLLRFIGLAPLVPIGAVALKPAFEPKIAASPSMRVVIPCDQFVVTDSGPFPCVFEDGVLRLDTANIGEVCAGSIKWRGGELDLDLGLMKFES